MTVTYSSTLVDLDSKLWGMVFPVPAEVVTDLLELTTDRRVLCRFDGQDPPRHVALMPDGQGGYFINFGKDLRKSLQIAEGDTVDLELSPDNSRYGMPLPEEMAVLLEQDPEAEKYFHGLSLGKQRALLYLIGKPKTSATRLKKAIGITDYLKRVEGRLDFKEMHAALKQA